MTKPEKKHNNHIRMRQTEKTRIRAHFLSARAALPVQEREEKSARICSRLGEMLKSVDGVIALYLPIKQEANIVAVTSILPDKSYALPAIEHHGAPCFRRYYADEPLIRTQGFPAPGNASPLCVPDVIVCPLLAYDSRGHRLGYGRGFYDRAIASAPKARTIGVAFREQFSADPLPAEPHDKPMDAIVAF